MACQNPMTECLKLDFFEGAFNEILHTTVFSLNPLLHGLFLDHDIIFDFYTTLRERSGSEVECLTQDGRAAGSSLTGVTVLWSLSKTHLS